MAAVCKLANDILKSNTCGYSLKQITDIYLANYEDVTATTLGTSGASIETITLAAEAKFYHIEPNKDSASFEDTLQVGDAGAKYRQTSLSWSVGGVYNDKQVNNLDALSLGRYVAVTKLSDGTYVMFGRLTPLEAETASFSSAAEATGFNGIQVTMTNSTTEPPLPLSEAAAKTVTGAA